MWIGGTTSIARIRGLKNRQLPRIHVLISAIVIRIKVIGSPRVIGRREFVENRAAGRVRCPR